MPPTTVSPAPVRLCLDSSADPLIDSVMSALPGTSSRRVYARAFDSLRTFSKGHPVNRLMLVRWLKGMDKLSPSTRNVRLAAVRTLLREAFRTKALNGDDFGELMQIKGVPRRGARGGRWLTAEDVREVLKAFDRTSARGKRDTAVLAVLVYCALRRSELAHVQVEDLQRREGRWVFADLTGKGGRIRTVPVPGPAKVAIDAWLKAGAITTGPIFRPLFGEEPLSEATVYDIVRKASDKVGIPFAPHDLRRTCAKLCRKKGGQLEQIQMLLGHASIQTTEIYLGSGQDLVTAVNDDLGI